MITDISRIYFTHNMRAGKNCAHLHITSAQSINTYIVNGDIMSARTTLHTEARFVPDSYSIWSMRTPKTDSMGRVRADGTLQRASTVWWFIMQPQNTPWFQLNDYLAPGGGCEVLFSPGLSVGLSVCVSVCLSVCVCVCVSGRYLVFYFSAIRRDIDLKFIQDTYIVVLNSMTNIDLHMSKVKVTGTVHCFLKV